MAGHDDAATTHSTDSKRRCGEAGGGGAGVHAGSGAALWRVALAEGCGAALLVLLTCAASCAPAARDRPLQRALASGLVVALLVQCLEHASGAQLNPAVTLAALVCGRVSRRRALAEALAQLAGGAAGAGALRALQPAAPRLCVTRPAPHLAGYQAACVEALLGGCAALANCAAWHARAARGDSWPLRIGLSVAGLSLVAGELTGASMNPARSFGPALWSGDWASHWVYWVGPLSGSVLFTSVYMCAWRPARCDVTPRRSERDDTDAPPLAGARETFTEA